ncbi:hypothetical protein ACR6C2_25295 [Streptomyces sp. INA 01156]
MPGESTPPRTDTDTDHPTAGRRVPYREMTADDYARDFTREGQALPVDDETTVLSGVAPAAAAPSPIRRPRAFRSPGGSAGAGDPGGVHLHHRARGASGWRRGLRGLLEREAGGPVTTGPRLTPGRPAVAADRAAARRMRQALTEELPKVREAALAWRNGLAGLFVGLLGFGLVKGRTDVGKLASPYDALVGGVLLLSLVCGAVGALYLLRAAHGMPVAAPLAPEPGPSTAARYAGDHVEAGRACGRCAGAWSSPWRAARCWWRASPSPGTAGEGDPRLLVKTPAGTECGEPRRTEHGVVVLKTDTGETRVSLADATAVIPVESCREPRRTADPPAGSQGTDQGSGALCMVVLPLWAEEDGPAFPAEWPARPWAS